LVVVHATSAAADSYVDDCDADGVPDASDNCPGIPNGPLAGDCRAQQDTDGDGFGNACDADFNQNGNAGLGDDFTYFPDTFGTESE